MEKISSKFIEEKDIVIPKPTYLRTLINIKEAEKTFFKIIDFNFNLENSMLSNINEFFIGDKTLFSVKVPISISLEEELFNFFYRSSNLEEEKKYESITIYSKAFYFNKNSKEMYLKFDNNHFEVIPSEEEIIFNFLIDNLDLAQKLQKANNSKI